MSMENAPRSRLLPTSHGRIAVVDKKGREPTLLMLHSNSTRKEIFNHQFAALGGGYRLVAFDLPGHGQSDDASDPLRSYCLGGYADCAMELLRLLRVERVVVFGNSLGGHVALELIDRWPALLGIVLSGSPPFRKSADGLAEAFGEDPRASLSFKPDMSKEEVIDFANAATDGVEPKTFWEAAVARTDPAARALLGKSVLADASRDQYSLAVNSKIPIAVFNGAEDTLIDHGHVALVPFGHLWNRQIYSIPGQRHAPQLGSSNSLNQLLLEFLDSLAC